MRIANIYDTERPNGEVLVTTQELTKNEKNAVSFHASGFFPIYNPIFPFPSCRCFAWNLQIPQFITNFPCLNLKYEAE